MFYTLGFELDGNVAPGEIIYIEENGTVHSRTLKTNNLLPVYSSMFILPDPTLSKTKSACTARAFAWVRTLQSAGKNNIQRLPGYCYSSSIYRKYRRVKFCP